MFPAVFHLLRLKLDPCYDKQLSYWKSTTTLCVALGGLNLSARGLWRISPLLAEKGKSTSVLLTVHLQPGSEHSVCMARNKNKHVIDWKLSEPWMKKYH